MRRLYPPPSPPRGDDGHPVAPAAGSGDEQPDEMSSPGRHLRALLFLFVCVGVTRYLVTGDGPRAGLTTMLMIGVLALIALLAPHRIGTGRPVWMLYAIGIAMVLAPFSGLRFGYQNPWDELADRYPATGALPAQFACADDVALVRPIDAIQVKRYRFRRIQCAVGDDGIRLAHSWPLSLVYEPIGLPRQAVASCFAYAMESGRTALALEGIALVVEVDDLDERLLDWCRSGEPRRSGGSG